MSLLQNEDFVIWYLRNSYLANIKDGVGERLITLNSSVLNTPGFRAAGWTANNSEIKRTYSPPIPTALTSEYFQVPRPGRQTPASFGEDEEEGGMVTGGGSNDAIGPGPILKRRRRKDNAEEEDSSDLSDDSDDDFESTQRAAQQIKFAKMPLRNRSESMPVREGEEPQEGPEVNVISPSRRSVDGRLRTGSLGAVEAVKARARRGTATSSDMSSETEIDPAYFQRRDIGQNLRSITTNTSSEAPEEMNAHSELGHDEMMDEDSGEGSVGSTLSSEFGETVESGSLLDNVGVAGLPDSVRMLNFDNILPSGNMQSTSPKKTRTMPSLQPLPAPRPISVIQPVSLLGAALRAQKSTPSNPLETFQALSGKGSPNPLYIKVYTPFSDDPEDPFEMLLDRQNKDGANVTVAEAIGFALWRYQEERLQPPIGPTDLNVNMWVLRMVEDGEVEYDFPPLGRIRPMLDFTNNNLRAARARTRDRPWDEFALVKADARQQAENKKITPHHAGTTEEAPFDLPKSAEIMPSSTPLPGPVTRPHAGGLGQPFPSALNYSSLTPADQPAPTTSSATPRIGVTKTLRIRYMELDFSTQETTMEIATDNYMADILDHVCKRWNLDKAGFLLKVRGTNTVAPLDRTIEALGNWSDLDLVRRRFVGGQYSLTGSPGSSSPNAPLLIDIDGPKKGKKNTSLANLMSSAAGYKRYVVIRKQPMSFTQANLRSLTFDGDYIHIMPAETAKTLNTATGKTTSILYSNVIGSKVSRKHPKSFRLVVRRGNEQKRYDFEAKNTPEAAEIVEEIRKFMQN